MQIEGTQVLVTGGSGFVGLHLVRELARAGAAVVATTRSGPPRDADAFFGDAGARVRWARGDVLDAAWRTELVAEGRFDAIVHAAAVTPTPQVLVGATRTVLETNLGATFALLDEARAAGVRRFVFASSTGVYAGSAEHRTRRVDEALRPHNLYALCKLASEGIGLEYARLHPIEVASVRIGTVFGPMERPTRSRTGLSFVATAIDAALRGAELHVSHPEVGRDVIFGPDVGTAVVALLEAPNLAPGVFNLANEAAVPVATVLDALGPLAGLRWRRTEVAEADLALTPAHHRDGVDLSELRAATGWPGPTPLDQALAATVAWQRTAT